MSFCGDGGKDEKTSENLTTYWSDRCRAMVLDKYPVYPTKYLYQVLLDLININLRAPLKLLITIIKADIGFAGFDYHNIVMKKAEQLQKWDRFL